MKELDLYRFFHETSIEQRWDGDVLSTWIPHYHLYELTKLVGNALDEGGVDARLQRDGVVWVNLAPVCEYFGVEPERIFPKGNE